MTLLGKAEVKATRALAKYTEVEELWTYKLAPDNPRDMLKAELIAQVHRQPDVKKWKDNHLVASAKVVLLKARKEGLSYYVQTVSREITRRGDEIKGGGRLT